MHIADGFHVNANDPGHPEVIPMNFHVIGTGVELTVEYPEGTPFSGPFGDATLRAYEGRVTFPVVLQRQGDPMRRPPSLMVLYQVCTDRACMAPSRSMVPVTLQVR
jgi:hypothetical protein